MPGLEPVADMGKLEVFQCSVCHTRSPPGGVYDISITHNSHRNMDTLRKYQCAPLLGHPQGAGQPPCLCVGAGAGPGGGGGGRHSDPGVRPSEVSSVKIFGSGQTILSVKYLNLFLLRLISLT